MQGIERSQSRHDQVVGTSLNCGRERLTNDSPAQNRFGMRPPHRVRVAAGLEDQRVGRGQLGPATLAEIEEPEDGDRFEMHPDLRSVVVRPLERTHVEINEHG